MHKSFLSWSFLLVVLGDSPSCYIPTKSSGIRSTFFCCQKITMLLGWVHACQCQFSQRLTTCLISCVGGSQTSLFLCSTLSNHCQWKQTTRATSTRGEAVTHWKHKSFKTLHQCWPSYRLTQRTGTSAKNHLELRADFCLMSSTGQFDKTVATEVVNYFDWNLWTCGNW